MNHKVKGRRVLEHPWAVPMSGYCPIPQLCVDLRYVELEFEIAYFRCSIGFSPSQDFPRFRHAQALQSA